MIDRSLILSFVLDLVARTALVFALFLLFTGHNAPGGGFVAGLVTGIVLILRFVALGRQGIASVLPDTPETIMGVGLALSVLTGVSGFLWGESFLSSASIDLHLPMVGDLHATTALPFDIGVFLVVVGLTAALITTLGEERDEP